VVAYEGDLWLVERGATAARRLTQTVAAETAPRFAADGRRVFFVRENNVYALGLEGGLVRQLTDVRAGPQPDSARAGAQRRALEAEQRALFDVVRDRVVRDSVQAAERKAREAGRPTPLWLQAGERVTSFLVAPSGEALLLATTTTVPRARTAQVPEWVTRSGYVEELPTRTKVGDDQANGRIAFLKLATGQLPTGALAARDPVGHGAGARGRAAAGVERRRDDGARVGRAARLQGARAERGARRLGQRAHARRAARQRVGGRPVRRLRGLAARRARLVRERGRRVGAPVHGRRRRQRPAAAHAGEVRGAAGRALARRRQFWLHTSERSVFDRDFYTMPVAGGARTRLTRDPGGHQVVPSPDGRLLADVHSTANRPPELYLLAARAGAAPARLTTSPTADWQAFGWRAPEIVMLPGSDGVPVPARVYRPQEMRAQPNGAAVIFVHGAGYLHNVHNWWSSYAREYMFNHYLASKGYVVLDIDYRGSAGYGRDWRTAIYRHMGGRDLQDHVDGVRWLQKTHGVDPERVGIYGGSYGGFITLMALFTEPKMFGAGAALRSVTDWAHYNHPYTARILNFPESDTVSYRRSSPIYFAAGLEDPLLMAHGMVDVNVHYQDIVRLSQRLIELGKTDWELASYPVEDHAFVRPSSWADEYRRIFELFERTIARRPIPAAGAAGSGGTR
jgi:dipeptidyl aminopeptidase/acylaminoacyl peptidase